MEFSAQQIAELVGGTVEGDAQRKVGTFAKIEEAGPHDLSFLANLKYAHHLYSTEAGVILIGHIDPCSRPLLHSGHAYENGR